MAGQGGAVETYRAWLTPQLARGQRVLTVRDARPEIRGVLDKAERYLGLSVLLSVMLAAVAILLSARHFLRRHLDACALMRCFRCQPAQYRHAVCRANHRAGRDWRRGRDRFGIRRASRARGHARQAGQSGAAACRLATFLRCCAGGVGLAGRIQSAHAVCAAPHTGTAHSAP